MLSKNPSAPAWSGAAPSEINQVDRPSNQPAAASLDRLALLFLVSGFAALIYQIVWQRVLFTAFGVNIESVTVIVSVFMFGLGVGSLVGGQLSKRYPRASPRLFLLCEMVIGLFGLISLPLMKSVSQATLHSSMFTVTLTTYALLCLPTIFMGATLPILVTHLHRHYRNVGKSVGRLYFINTVGSAIACFLTADVLFVVAGLQTAVLVAALCNFLVGLLVYQLIRKGEAEAEMEVVSQQAVPPSASASGSRRARFLMILGLSAAVGYLALSQEILWFRILLYATGGAPDVFAHVLGFLLLGIAFGARDTTKVYDKGRGSALTHVAIVLSVAALVYYLSIPIVGQISTVSGGLGMGALFTAVLVVAFLTGGIFPALCHYGIESEAAVGLSLSWVYFANIVGSTAGPLLTGFVLMNSFTLQQMVLGVSAVTLALAALVWLVAPVSARVRALAVGGLVVGLAAMLGVHDTVYAHLLEKLHYKAEYAEKPPYKYVVQNRNGIVAVEPGPSDIVYGGGIYDGTFNLDPVADYNGITRGYMLAALHSSPREVLEIGLSTGSWARVLACHQGVERLTVVEINPAYEVVIRQYPDAAGLLTDPKVTIHIDDGRRWLNRNPDRKFDFIEMNTTFHWRDMSTNLLSEEFVRLCRDHLKEGGVFFYNATASDDVAYTAAQVFKHVTHVGSFVAASDRPLVMSPEDRRRNLLQFQLPKGKAIFSDEPALREAMEKLVASPTPDEGDELRARKDLWKITDDNMAVEFKRKYSRQAAR